MDGTEQEQINAQIFNSAENLILHILQPTELGDQGVDHVDMLALIKSLPDQSEKTICATLQDIEGDVWYDLVFRLDNQMAPEYTTNAVLFMNVTRTPILADALGQDDKEGAISIARYNTARNAKNRQNPMSHGIDWAIRGNDDLKITPTLLPATVDPTEVQSLYLRINDLLLKGSSFTLIDSSTIQTMYKAQE